MDLMICAQNKQNYNETICLCNACGFWGLWYKFYDCPQVDSNPYKKYLMRESWQKFIEEIEPKMELIRTADLFYGLSNRLELTEQQEKWIKEYKEWYSDNFECTPILGYDYDAESLIHWYEKKDEVWEYLYNNDYHVIVHNSF